MSFFKLRGLYLPGSLSASDRKIGLQNFPIPTVNFIVQRPDNMILQVKGKLTEPCFVFEGEQSRGKTLRQSLHQVAFSRLGMEACDIKKVLFSHNQDVYRHSAVNMPASHVVWHFYILKCHQDFIPKLSDTSLEASWLRLDELPPIPKVVQDALVMAEKNELLWG